MNDFTAKLWSDEIIASYKKNLILAELMIPELVRKIRQENRFCFGMLTGMALAFGLILIAKALPA